MIARLNSLQDLQMLQSLREETEGKLQMPLSPRKNCRTSLFKEVRFSRNAQEPNAGVWHDDDNDEIKMPDNM